MRILFDAHWWVDGPRSGRNVLRGLVSGWLRAFPDDELHLRAQRRHVSAVEEDAQQGQLRVNVSHYPRWARYHALAVATIAARKDEFDAVLTQNFCPPLSTAPRLVLLHDALFVTNPEWFTKTELVYLSGIRPSLRRATNILTTSNSETARVGAVWPELRDRLVKVGLSVPDGVLEAQPRRPSSLYDELPFILAVGRLNVRKNLAGLIEAFVRIACDDPQPHLVIAGSVDGAYVPVVVPDEMTGRIHFLGHVTDDELRWLYENCELFVCPSLDEGYGLPLIEARILGAEVIASDIPAFRELGIAKAYFDPRSIDEMAATIRDSLDVVGPALAGQLRWEDVAWNVRAAIEKVRRRSNAPNP